jgi:hypothetical protein
VGALEELCSAIVANLVTAALVVGRYSVRMVMCVNNITSVLPLPDNLTTKEEQWQVRLVIDYLLVLILRAFARERVGIRRPAVASAVVRKEIGEMIIWVHRKHQYIIQ